MYRDPPMSILDAAHNIVRWLKDNVLDDDIVELCGLTWRRRGELYAAPQIVPMILTCPSCSERHIDEGEFALKPHHTHACQKCGMVWRPSVVNTVGVRYLPGFKNKGECDVS